MTNRTTGIEWTEHTWNPFVGCSIHTPGCTNCYAMKQAARIIEMGTTPSYDGTVRIANGKPIWTGRVNRATPATMKKPFQITEPSIIFVNSMSDFWHENAQDEWRIEALGVMASTPHQYQVLTKRPEHIAPFLERQALHIPDNVWIGATIERGDFLHRIDTLRGVPARIRFLSVEPLIGPIGRMNLDGIQWVIGGGESGPGARSMKAEWARELRDECTRQGVAFFWKQWGKPQNNPLYFDIAARRQAIEASRAGTGSKRLPALTPLAWVETFDANGKGGSKIDGREWKEYPDFQPQGSLF
jgi:protein gp37